MALIGKRYLQYYIYDCSLNCEKAMSAVGGRKKMISLDNLKHIFFLDVSWTVYSGQVCHLEKKHFLVWNQYLVPVDNGTSLLYL